MFTLRSMIDLFIDLFIYLFILNELIFYGDIS